MVVADILGHGSWGERPVGTLRDLICSLRNWMPSNKNATSPVDQRARWHLVSCCFKRLNSPELSLIRPVFPVLPVLPVVQISMATSDPIDELMARWEAARQQGQDPPIEELCADAPHLADEMRQRIRIVLEMEGILGVTEHDPRRTMTPPLEDHGEPDFLPTIPGYEIIRIIDQGGMGVVYEARQPKAGRTVAIKMISGKRLRPKVVARFCSEAKAAAKLQHPNFVQIFDVNESGGKPYYAMEYLAGGSLADLLTRKPPTAPRLGRTRRDAGAGHAHGSRARDHPSRSQAVQRDVDRQRHAEDRRLRSGQAPR